MARILGLHLTSRNVHAALVRAGVRSSEVLQYATAPIAVDGLPDDEVSLWNATSIAIQHAVAALAMSFDFVVVGIDGTRTSLRNVELPATASKRIADVLPFELETALPFTLEQIVVDYQHVRTAAGHIHLLAAAAPKTSVAAVIETVRAAGLDPREIAAGAAALDGLVNIVPALKTDECVAIVDLGWDHTDVCVLDAGRCVSARTLSTGLVHVRSGLLEVELQRTMVAARAAGAADLARVYLVGEGARDSNAESWLSGKLGIETAVLPLPGAPGTDALSLPQFARAAALAARIATRSKRIDLRRGEFAFRRSMGALRQHASLFAVTGAAVLFAFGFSVYARWSTLTDERETLQAQLSQICQTHFDRPCSTPARARELLAGEGATADPIPRLDAFGALEAISDAIPAGVSHETQRLQIQLEDDLRSGRFELQGSVQNMEHYDQIYAALEGNGCFHELKRGQTTQVGGRASYRLEAAIRCAGETDTEQTATAPRVGGGNGTR